MSQEINYKIILAGNSGIGKTSLFKKLTTGIFLDKNFSTIGLTNRTLNIEITDNKKEKKMINVNLYDTAGQERYRAITSIYLKSSQGILLIYEISDRTSFLSIESWINSITEHLGNIKDSKYVVILIGNKIDLANKDNQKREVTEEEAKIICEKFDLIWGGEISVRDISCEELNELFQSYVKQIYDKVGEMEPKEEKLKKIVKNKKKIKFC